MNLYLYDGMWCASFACTHITVIKVWNKSGIDQMRQFLTNDNNMKNEICNFM